ATLAVVTAIAGEQPSHDCRNARVELTRAGAPRAGIERRGFFLCDRVRPHDVPEVERGIEPSPQRRAVPGSDHRVEPFVELERVAPYHRHHLVDEIGLGPEM